LICNDNNKKQKTKIAAIKRTVFNESRERERKKKYSRKRKKKETKRKRKEAPFLHQIPPRQKMGLLYNKTQNRSVFTEQRGLQQQHRGQDWRANRQSCYQNQCKG
jgi:hypothetical protein